VFLRTTRDLGDLPCKRSPVDTASRKVAPYVVLRHAAYPDQAISPIVPVVGASYDP
jgi:hypothetical protein